MLARVVKRVSPGFQFVTPNRATATGIAVI
jgi:hypothetical protein